MAKIPKPDAYFPPSVPIDLGPDWTVRIVVKDRQGNRHEAHGQTWNGKHGLLLLPARQRQRGIRPGRATGLSAQQVADLAKTRSSKIRQLSVHCLGTQS